MKKDRIIKECILHYDKLIYATSETIELVSYTLFYHWQILPGVERMLAILHHVDQHRLGDPGLVVGLSVHIEVTEAGTPEGTDLAVERFHAPVDILMFLQLLTRVELLLTQLALLCL